MENTRINVAKAKNQVHTRQDKMKLTKLPTKPFKAP